MKVIALDTSNQMLSIGVLDGNTILGKIQLDVGKKHSITLMPFIEVLMKNIGLSPKKLEKVVVAEGPGSYTGLKVGVTVAKTLATSLNIKLVGVSSLKVIAANCLVPSTIVPIFDARRKNVYAGGYKWENEELINIIPDQHISFSELLKKLASLSEKIYFVGKDTLNFRENIQNFSQGVINQYVPWDFPDGFILAKLGEKEPSENINEFIPKYLKLVEAEEK